MKTAFVSIAALMMATPALANTDASVATFCETAFFPGDRNADGMIDATEAEAVSAATFTALDLDVNGSINREEFVACTSRAGGSGEMATDAASFDALDGNGDGMVDTTEYFNGAGAMFDSISENREPGATGWSRPFIQIPSGMSEQDVINSPRDQFIGQAARAYRITDSDLDGMLSQSEWTARAQTYEVDVDAMTERFNAMDANGDGEVFPDEYGATLQAGMALAEENADRDGFTDRSKGIPAQYFYMSAM